MGSVPLERRPQGAPGSFHRLGAPGDVSYLQPERGSPHHPGTLIDLRSKCRFSQAAQWWCFVPGAQMDIVLIFCQ